MTTNEYLRADIVALKKKTLLTLWVGGALSLLVLVYAATAIWYSQVFSNTDDLSTAILVTCNMQAPRAISAMEERLKENAPALAEVFSKAYQEAIPQLRIYAQNTLDSIVAENFDGLEESLVQMTRSYIEAHREEFKPQAPDETVEVYGKRIANVLCDQFGKNLDRELIHTTGLSLNDFGARTCEILAIFRQHMGKAAGSEFATLSREEQLERLIIAHIVNKYFAAIPR